MSSQKVTQFSFTIFGGFLRVSPSLNALYQFRRRAAHNRTPTQEFGARLNINYLGGAGGSAQWAGIGASRTKPTPDARSVKLMTALQSTRRSRNVFGADDALIERVVCHES
jgi:hypothetical protein